MSAVTLAAGLVSLSGGCVPGAGGRTTTPVQPSVDRADQLRDDVRRMFTTARERVFPALVNIHVVTVSYWDGKEQKGASVGSGTIISPAGYVVTNQHVTSDGEKFRCTLTDKREVDATLVGEDPLTDLAILKLDLTQLGDETELPVATWGDSEALVVGDYVMAMGSPFSLSRSVTLGIVSNVERVFGGEFGGDEVEELYLDWGQRTGLFTNWIQHDAAINPGNSGGPLVNLRGEIIGVNELGGTNMGFAIPSNLARDVAADLIAHGAVPRSFIGVSLKAIQRTGIERGVLVNSIVKEGPADRAGLAAGDVITAIDGEKVNVRFLEQVPPLLKRIANRAIGSDMHVTYERDGVAHDATIVTAALQKDKGEEEALRGWGLTIMAITPRMARERRLDSTAGALVTSIRSGGPAATAEPPIGWGSVIRAVDGQPINGLIDLVEQYRTIMARDPLPEYLLVEFEEDGRNQVTLIEPRPDEQVDPPREVRKAWIGIATQPVLRNLAEQLGFGEQTGFRVTRVYPRTRAAETALRVGDVIVGLNGADLNLRGLQDAGLLQREVRKLDTDGSATLTVLRGGTTQDVQVPLESTRLTQEEARRDTNDDFELTVREVTFFDRDQQRWDPELAGVIVERVESAGWAGLAGISSGDLIQRIDDKDVLGLKSYRKIMQELAEQQSERVVFVVLRGVRTHFHFVEPDWSPQVEEEPETAAHPDAKE
jgi:serine protease Do